MTCPNCGSTSVTLPEDWTGHDNDRALCRSCGISFTGYDVSVDEEDEDRHDPLSDENANPSESDYWSMTL